MNPDNPDQDFENDRRSALDDLENFDLDQVVGHLLRSIVRLESRLANSPPEKVETIRRQIELDFAWKTPGTEVVRQQLIQLPKTGDWVDSSTIRSITPAKVKLNTVDYVVNIGCVSNRDFFIQCVSLEEAESIRDRVARLVMPVPIAHVANSPEE